MSTTVEQTTSALKHLNNFDLSTHPFGWLILAIFVVGYIVIALEEQLHINKAKPALFIGTFTFILIGGYIFFNGYDPAPFKEEVHHVIYEIATIFFFLYVAMTYIETLIERRVFESLKFKLVHAGYSYKKLFWITGFICFFISPIADNLTSALILSTVLLTMDKNNIKFLVPGAINIVVAANAGGAWSPFGDITTLMVWQDGKADFIHFLDLFPSSFIGYVVTAYLLSLFVPHGKPTLHDDEKKPELKKGAKLAIAFGVFTIICAVLSKQIFYLPPAWGMVFGLTLLMGLIQYLKIKEKDAEVKNVIDSFKMVAHIEHDTLLFFFGILAAVGSIYFVGFLHQAVKLYAIFGVDPVNIALGILSSIVDNVPVMAAVLKADPNMSMNEWMLATLTIGIGGSLLSFGSAAGVGVMGKMRGIYTLGNHLKLAWAVMLGFIVSVIVWYIQFEQLKWVITEHHS